MADQYARYRSYSQQANPFHDQPEQPGGGDYPSSPQQNAPTLYGGAQAPSAAGAAIGRVMRPQPGAGGRRPSAAPAALPSQAAPVAQQNYQARGPAMGLEGFDQGKLTGGHVSPKYVFARHAQGLGMNDRDELLRRLQADPSGYFKNAMWGGSKGDKLTIGGQLAPEFNGINTFDVIRAAGLGGQGWQWGAEGPGGAGPAPSANPMGMLMGSAQGMTVPVGAGGNYSDQILRYLMQQLAINKTLGA